MNPHTRPEPSVLVAGAGPVGLTLAAELLRHGVRARVVDMNDGPSLWSKAAVVHARTLEAMEAMGCADAALARGRRVHALGFYTGSERVGQVSIDSLDSPYPFILGISQRETEILLEQHLRALGGEIERRVELASFTQDDAGVNVRLLRDASCETATVPWLVGCDGAHSMVRKTLEIPFEGSTYEEAILQADVRIRWPFPAPPDEGLFFASPRGVLAALPVLAEGRYRLLCLLGSEEQYDPTLESFRLLMDERGPAGAVVDDPAWMVTFRFHHRMVPRYRKGRVFLAGDAAHVHSPVGGQGMNMGMLDAVNLAWKLALVIRGEGRHALLDSYQTERLPVAAATLNITDAATRIAARALGLRSPLVQRLRDQLFRLACRLPVVEERAAAVLGGIAVDYRGSPIVSEHVEPLFASAPAAPGLLDRVSFEQGPGPGARVGDLELRVPWEGKERLFPILHGTAHTLLLLEGHAARPDADRSLFHLARLVRSRWGELVRAFVVTPRSDSPASDEGVPVLLDPGGEIHRRFGARAECAYLVRPDGYVGFRSQPADPDRLVSYLEGILLG